MQLQLDLPGFSGHGYTRPALSGESGRRDPRQDMWQGASAGLAISATLLSGVAIYGLIGYLIDRVAGTPKVFTAIGMVVGAGLGIYLVYLRYGREHDQER
jgi:ATP synthase protein I